MLRKITVEEGGYTLTQVLKHMGLVDNGGHAKALISEGRVRVNGEVEWRKRRQMAAGDVVEIEMGGPAA